MRKNIIITIDSNSRRIEYCVLEGIRLNPDTYFHFIEGKWTGSFPNFPIGPDRDLDLLIIVVGNPGTNSSMSVKIGDAEPQNSTLFRPFNRNGYGQFNQQIPLR